MNRPWVAIQRNPTSGTGRNRVEIVNLVRRLRQHGLLPRVYSQRERLDAKLDDPLARETLHCIVAAGGDGTVCDVANRFPGVSIATLPLGTENLLSKYLQIPRSGAFVGDMVAAKQTKQIDMGELNGRRFILMASFGFDADVVHRTHARRTGHISKLNYLQPIAKSLRKYQYPEITLHADGTDITLAGRMAVVVNIPAYALGLRFVESSEPDDGKFDVCVFERGSAFQMIRYFYKVAKGRHLQMDDVKTFRAAEVSVTSDTPVPAQVDGDPAGWTPCQLKVSPRTLEIIVPSGR